MKLEVGMYVRTTTGIHKLYNINDNATKWKYEYKCKEQDGDGTITVCKFCDDDIIGEPSYNIKDLIQCGDIVTWVWKGHGYHGTNEVIERPGFDALGVYAEEFDNLVTLDRITIYKVVTRELYDTVAFDVEEDEK